KAPDQFRVPPSDPAQIGPYLATSGVWQVSTPLRSAMSVPLIDPAMMFECLPEGGLWPEIVSLATWPFEGMITLAIAVPPRAMKTASVAIPFAYVRRLRVPPIRTPFI